MSTGKINLKVFWGAFDSAKNHKRQRRKRQTVTAKREKSQTPKFVVVFGAIECPPVMSS